MKYVLILLTTLIYTIACQAAIYMVTDKNGNIIYSDTPLKNATILNIPSANTIQSSNQSSDKAEEIKEIQNENLTSNITSTSYKKFLIGSPKNNETIQNVRDIPVSIDIEPALKKGDKIQLVMDGKIAGEPSESTSLVLNQVSRGKHEVTAVILNKDLTILKKANTVTIFVHLASANFKPS